MLRITVALLAACVALGTQIESHGLEFQNLDFEDAVIIPSPLSSDPFTTVLASDALPHWTTNGAPDGLIPYNFTCLGAGCTSIHDDESIFPTPPLQGVFSVNLLGPLVTPVRVPLFISQVGTVPPTATRLTLLVESAGADELDLSFDSGKGSTSLDLLTPFPTGKTVRLVYDVGMYAGTTGELKISSTAEFESFVFIDDLQFVPEPSDVLLVAIIGCAVAGCGRRVT